MSSPPSWLTPSGLPRWLTLALVQLAGLALLVAGCSLVFHGNYVGFLAIAYGVDMVMRPSARRLPRPETLTTLVLDVVDRWLRRKGPPAV